MLGPRRLVVAFFCTGHGSGVVQTVGLMLSFCFEGLECVEIS